MSYQETPLHCAVKAGDASAARVLLEQGAGPNRFSIDPDLEYRLALLRLSVRRGELATVRALLEGGADPNLQIGRGLIPHRHAAYHGDVEVARALLEYGADSNTRIPRLEETPQDLAELLRQAPQRGVQGAELEP